MITVVSQVWFQNRRAKWRRQEKMDASTMKLHDSPMLSFNRPATVHSSMGPMTNSLPLDPWLSSPLSSTTPVHSIPSFMGPAQGLQPSYPSHSFLNSTPHPHPHSHPHPHPHPSMGQGMQSMAPPPYHCPAPYPDKYPLEDVDQRSSSIATLRMKAKEHIQSMDKTWQPMWLTNLTVHVNDTGKGRQWSCFSGFRVTDITSVTVTAEEMDFKLRKLSLNFLFILFYFIIHLKDMKLPSELWSLVRHLYLFLVQSKKNIARLATCIPRAKECLSLSVTPYSKPSLQACVALMASNVQINSVTV